MEHGKFGFIEELGRQKPLKGVLTCRVYQYVNGEKMLIEEFQEHNIIVNLARDQMARLVAGEFEDRHITKIGFGTDITKATVDDTELKEVYVKDLDGFEYPKMGEVQFNWELDEDEANGMAIAEFGLFCEDGTLFARRRREDKQGEPLPPIPKASDISLEGTWTVSF